MANAEIETIIIINDADRAEGFFRIGTSNPSHRRKIEKRAGRHGQLVRESKDSSTGKTTWWQYQLPYRFLSPTLGLKSIPMLRRQGNPRWKSGVRVKDIPTPSPPPEKSL